MRFYSTRSARRWVRVPAWTLLFFAVCLPGGVQEVRADEVRVIYTDGRDRERLPVWSVDGASYLSVNDVGRVFNATKQWHSATQQLMVRYGGTQATLTVDSPVVLVGEEAYRLPSAVRLRKGIVQVPLELMTEVLPRPEGPRAGWDPASRTLRVGPEGVNVSAIHFRRLRRGLRATLTLAEPLAYSFDPEAVGGLKLSIAGGRGEAKDISRSFRSGLVKRVSATQLPSAMELLFVPFEGDLESRVVTTRDPDRIVVDITKPAGESAVGVPDPALKPRWALSPDEVLGRRGRGVIDLIVIDPGHGGIDTGARGGSGLEEKDAVLEIARRLEVLIQDELGIEAVLTRDEDQFMALRARTEMANALDAGLFVSIHCNASPKPDVHGFEVYFQSLKMGEEEELVAEFENAVLALEPGGGVDIEPENDIPFILWDMAQSALMAESSELADLVQESLGERLRTRNRGVKQANFVVLRGAHMPAVLLECGFATNEAEEALLRTEEYRRALARGIYEGLARFVEHYRTGGWE